MLLVRTLLALAMVGLGAFILFEMLAAASTGRFAILPGVLLGGAMIALGVHRLRLIARVRGML